MLSIDICNDFSAFIHYEISLKLFIFWHGCKFCDIKNIIAIEHFQKKWSLNF